MWLGVIPQYEQAQGHDKTPPNNGFVGKNARMLGAWSGRLPYKISA